jgi:alpha-beta hydrolase superfamily lysophospholipase
MLDPLQAPPPPAERGVVPLRDGAALAFARWVPPPGGAPPRGRCLLIVGALATARHLAPLAAFLSEAAGYEVVAYDHRGAGRSGTAAASAAAEAAAAGGLGAPSRGQSLLGHWPCAQSLARDALALLDAVWGPDAPVHVFGCGHCGRSPHAKRHAPPRPMRACSPA